MEICKVPLFHKLSGSAKKKRQFQPKYEKKLGSKENVEASKIHELTDLATDLHFRYLFPLITI